MRRCLLFGSSQQHFDEVSSFFAVADASLLNKYQEMTGVSGNYVLQDSTWSRRHTSEQIPDTGFHTD